MLGAVGRDDSLDEGAIEARVVRDDEVSVGDELGGRRDVDGLAREVLVGEAGGRGSGQNVCRVSDRFRVVSQRTPVVSRGEVHRFHQAHRLGERIGRPRKSSVSLRSRLI